jgi:hypothetical protein
MRRGTTNNQAAAPKDEARLRRSLVTFMGGTFFAAVQLA